MKHTAIILTCILMIPGMATRAQSGIETIPSDSVTEARHASGDVGPFLRDNTRYPIEALRGNVQGDVILSYFINKDGKLENLLVSGSTSDLLSTAAILAFDALGDDWIPATINSFPVGKGYKLVFRFRIFRESEPPGLKEKANKFEEKEKYSKALNLYDKAIADNPFDYELFRHRSKVREILGDVEGAKLDLEASNELKREIMAIVDITAILKTRTKVTRTIQRY